MTFDARRIVVFARKGAADEVKRFREHVVPRTRAIAKTLVNNGHIFCATVVHPLPRGNAIVAANLHRMTLQPKRLKGAKLSSPPKPKMRDSVTASMNPVSDYSNGNNIALQSSKQAHVDALRAAMLDKRNTVKERRRLKNELFMFLKSQH